MSGNMIVLVPALILPIVLLLAFAGCGFDGVATGEPDPPAPTPTPTPTPAPTPAPKPEPYASDIRAESTCAAYWRLDDAGTLALDTLKPADPVTNFQPGRPGDYVGSGIKHRQPGMLVVKSKNNDDKAVGLPGTIEGYVQIAHHISINPMQDFTVEAWVKPATAAPPAPRARQSVVCSLDVAGQLHRGFQLAVIRDTNPRWVVAIGTGVPGAAPGPALIEVTAPMGAAAGAGWYYVVFTYTKAGSIVRLYVNGAPTPDKPLPGVYAPNTNAASPLRIGAGKTVSPAAGEFFNGLIDEVALYSAALPPQRVKAHFDIAFGI